jgi:hypothetical protein
VRPRAVSHRALAVKIGMGSRSREIYVSFRVEGVPWSFAGQLILCKCLQWGNFI